MVKVISVKFNAHGKAYYFDPGELAVKAGDTLIVETSKGLDIGVCAFGEHYVTDESIIPPLRPVVRLATEDDLRIAEQNRAREKEAFAVCKEKIAAHGLEMKLVDVECGFEGNKILFFFTADGRVDFRDLVKDLAAVFRTRIELRQIGVRDETKMLGGLGICGRPYCCSQFLSDFQPVSTKMAKTQSMSLNPTKISGSCGRLMCCLRYEQDAYEELVKKIPKVGAFVQTSHGYGNVTSANVLRQKVKVAIDGGGEPELKVLDVDEVAVVPGGRPKPGEPLPQVLVPQVKAEKEPEAEEDPWTAPSLFAEDADASRKRQSSGERPAAPQQQARGKNEGHAQEQGKPRQQGGRNRPRQNTKPGEKPGGEQGKKPPKNAVPQAQQKPRPEGEQADAQKNKSRNANRNRRYRGNRPKPQGDNPKPQGDNPNQG